MPSVPVIYADFHNADAQGRVRLNSIGTVSDLSRQQVQLREHLAVELYSDDADEQGHERRLSAQGTVTYSPEEQCWMAIIDWQKIESHPANDSLSGVPGSYGSVANGKSALTTPQTSPPAAT